MAFEGWLSLGGIEVVNSARARTYWGSAQWLDRSRDPEDEDLHLALGDPRYGNPAIDNAPWVDFDDEDTLHFWGVYPTAVRGLEDSTRAAVITESALDGGFVGGRRRGTRQVAVTAMLVGEDDAAVAAGMNWLSSVLDGSCAGSSGDSLCYLQAMPPYIDGDLEDPAECADDYVRTIPRTSCVSGPTLLSKALLSDDCVIWQVQFVLASEVPWAYGPEELIAEDMIAASRADLDGFLWPITEFRDAACAQAAAIDPLAIIQDPSLPALPAAPSVPAITNLGYKPPDAWSRWAMAIPEDIIPQWNDVVPVIEIKSGATAVRYLRVRFHADPTGRFIVGDLDPCSFCGEFVISYMPPDSTLRIDATTERITLTLPGDISVNAESNVWGTDGGPFSWPTISCGFAYIMTLDTILYDQPPRSVSVSMAQRF